MRNIFLVVVVGSQVAGCSGGSVSEAPSVSYDAAGIARAALNDFDKNKNGLIEGTELDACPALKSALAAIDQNRDKGLSAGEIQQRVEQYAKLGPVGLTCTVMLDDRPLTGASITFEPEPCMGASLKTVTATTDTDGVASTFEVDGTAVTTLPSGLYRIRITKAGTNIPARYNTQTTLGREIYADSRQGEAVIELALRSR